MSNTKNRLGQRFGKLVVIEQAPSEKRLDGNGTFARWKCKCDCGKETIVRGNGLATGTTKSCGCLHKDVATRRSIELAATRPPGEMGLRRVYAAYRDGSKKRGLIFNLTLEEFRFITSQNCHYCGTAPKTVAGNEWKTEWVKYIYNGIDRKDNNIGYILSNSLPCCEFCNKAKGTKSYIEFLNWIKNLCIFHMNNHNDIID